MLVLTLTPKGDEVTLTDKTTGRHLATVSITQVRGDHVRVGFVADKDQVDIVRGRATAKTPKPTITPQCPPDHVGQWVWDDVKGHWKVVCCAPGGDT